MNSFFRKLRWLTQRRGKEAELREELQFHLEEEAEQRQAEGLAEEEARWAARRELGNLTLVQENTRAVWGWTILEQLGQDLRYAFRTMAANRLFTLLAVSSLALGIGANTAIYSFMDSILLRSLPVSDPESLVVLNWHAKPTGRDSVMHGMSGTTYDDPKTGTTAGIFPFPGVRTFPEKRLRLFERVRPLPILASEKPERDDQRTGRPCQRLERLGRLFSRTRRSPGCRAADHSRRRPGGSAAGGRRQLRVQSKAFRRSRQRGRPADSDRQPALHRGGRYAAGILRRRSRGGSGRLSSDAHQ